MPGPATDLLQRIKAGDGDAHDALYGVLYDRLRRLAQDQLRRETDAPTLTPTALVHEAYLALVGHEDGWNDHAHALAVASRAMRHILVDYARKRATKKRGEGAHHTSYGAHQSRLLGPNQPVRLDDHAHALLDLNRVFESLNERDPRLGRVIECRVFGGLTKAETAAALDISTATVDRDWARARAYIRTALNDA